MTDAPETLQRSDQGLMNGRPVPGSYSDYVNGGESPDGTYVRVYESSAAFGPHIWVAVNAPGSAAQAHMTLENARHVRDQLTHLIEHHYQLPVD